MDQKKILVFIGASYVSGLEIVTLHLVQELIKKWQSGTVRVEWVE